MSRFMICVVAFISFCLFLSGDCPALELSADFTIRDGNRTEEGSLAIKGGKYRVQSKGRDEYTIFRGDRKISWFIVPSEKACMEMPFDPEKQKIVSEKLEGEVSRKLLGTETVSGLSAKKYEVTVKQQGADKKMYQWVAADIDFPVKISSADEKMTMEYRNIKRSADDSLFEMPKGYEKISVPIPPGFPGIPDDDPPTPKKK